MARYSSLECGKPRIGTSTARTAQMMPNAVQGTAGQVRNIPATNVTAKIPSVTNRFTV
jgi:hypothetical protein